jgi:hypothetical protein
MTKAAPTYVGLVVETLPTSPCFPYLKGHLKDLEWHFKPTEDDEDFDRCETAAIPPHDHRIPDNGDTSPTPNDRPIGHDPYLIKSFGTSLWDWRNGVTLGCVVDVDCGHGESAHSEEEITEWDAKAAKCPYLLNVTSKGGLGRGGFVILENPQPAKTRAEHKANCKRIVAKLCADFGINPDFFCKRGEIGYIFHRGHAEGGYQLKSAATSKLPFPADINLSCFNDAEPSQPTKKPAKGVEDDFNATSDFGFLTDYGWKKDGANLIRPGKDKGNSGGIVKAKDGTQVFHVFTSAAPPFEIDHNYSAFDAYALLKHGGDREAARADLLKQGYGQASCRAVERVGANHLRFVRIWAFAVPACWNRSRNDQDSPSRPGRLSCQAGTRQIPAPHDLRGLQSAVARRERGGALVERPRAIEPRGTQREP